MESNSAPNYLEFESLFVEKTDQFVAVPVPELGGDVLIKILSAAENMAFCAWASDNSKQFESADRIERYTYELLLRTVHGRKQETEIPLFPDHTDANRQRIFEGAHGPAINRLFDHAQELNGFTRRAEDLKKKLGI